MPTEDHPKPKTFFLNERQELSTFAKEGFGRSARYDTADWPQRFAALGRSFRVAFAPQDDTIDPMAREHHFVAAVPAVGIRKFSESPRAAATQGRVSANPAFGGNESRLLGKLGLSLVSTLPGGRALVHVAAAGVARLGATIGQLPHAAEREQARWVNVDRFEPVSWTDRVDAEWLDTLDEDRPSSAIIRFQPILSRVEAQQLLRALNGLLDQRHTRLLKADRTFAGRYWCSAMLTRQIIQRVAHEFASVQSVHEPLVVPVSGPGTAKKVSAAMYGSAPTGTPPSGEAVNQMPSVAILDTGIPTQHPVLGPYRRNGFRSPDLDDLRPYWGEHGTRVASCVVFGEVRDAQVPPSAGSCLVVDAVVATDPQRVDYELVTQALDALAGTAPDIRVFNLSFDSERIGAHSEVKRQEYLLKLQDLDNFAFERDVLLVVAAGNTPPGQVPEQAYPRHLDDERWSLGITARSFNGAVCGAYVRTPVPGGVGGQEGHPSPFTRVGPGQNDSPVPGFSAPGGDWAANYASAPGFGVWVCGNEGLWEDRCGTSYAAPLVAREAAFVFQELRRHCPQGVPPYAATVRAWMHLVARRPSLSTPYERLAMRTLGRGFPTATRLRSPSGHSAVFIWQTTLPGPGQVCRVQIPVPEGWLRTATEPRLDVVATWNTPVSAALTDSWAARKVQLRIRPFGGEKALRGGGASSGAYPVIHRELDIGVGKLEEGEFPISDDLWTIEVEYEQIGAYALGRPTVDSQRVGVVVELYDAAETPVSPQAFIQSLPLAASMDRLSLPDLPLHVPIPLR